MQITYKLTQSDFVQGMNWNTKRATILWLVAWALLILGSLGILARLLLQSSPAMVNITPLCVLMICWAVLFLWVLPWWAARMFYRRQPSVEGPRTMLVDDSGVQWHWDGGSVSAEWRTFIRWYEGKNGFLLYSSPVLFNIVPKRAFSDDQVAEFRTLLLQHIASDKR